LTVVALPCHHLATQGLPRWPFDALEGTENRPNPFLVQRSTRTAGFPLESRTSLGTILSTLNSDASKARGRPTRGVIFPNYLTTTTAASRETGKGGANLPGGPPARSHIAGRVGRSLGKALSGGGIHSETQLNEEILSGLRKQFSQERVDTVVDERSPEYLSHRPETLTRPEPYELYQTGFI
jgi:hypothetical protein